MLMERNVVRLAAVAAGLSAVLASDDSPSTAATISETDDFDQTLCNVSGIWHGHPGGPRGKISPISIPVVQSAGGGAFTAMITHHGTINGSIVHYDNLTGTLSANTLDNATAPACTRISWHNKKHTYWCKEPWCAWTPAPAPWVPPPPPPPSPPGLPNVIFIITDDQDVELGSLSSMPILQRELVEQGTTLQNFFVTVPVHYVSSSSKMHMVCARRRVMLAPVRVCFC